jgi:hypothetical protein
LHYVLDEWFEQEVKPRLKGRAFLVRYADDFVMGFACEADARQVLDVLPKRFGKYGLTLHPDKTRLVPFGRPARSPAEQSGPKPPSPGSFDFLGMTWFWSRSKQGYWVVKQKTARSRFRRALGTIAQWCRRNLHRPIAEQHQALGRKLRGHFQYYGVIGNGRSLWCFRYRVIVIWKHWLARRGGKGGCTWSWINQLLDRAPLPTPPGWVQPCVAKP